MNYKDLLKQCEEKSYIINMTPIEGIIKTGLSLGLNENSNVLDLCCGYGEMLKIWSEAFGISGIGVDISNEFINVGKTRLEEAGIEKIKLIEGDILKYTDLQKYDVVCCTETLGSIEETLNILEKYVKPNGKLVFCHIFSKVPNPPKELTDFEGTLHTLDELYKIFKQLGYYITNIASDTVSEWERYITWSAKRDIARLRKDKNDKELADWIDKWYHMYFNYRRPYEGQALFVLEKL